MMPFVILALAFTFGALMLVLPPLLGRGATAPEQGRDEQAATVLQVLREQLAELDAELTEGRMDAATHARQKDELEARALAEGEVVGVAPAATAGGARGWALLTGIVVPVLALGLYLSLGNPDGLDPAKVAGNEQITPEQVSSMVAGLAERLKGEPDNLEGWMMLARSYTALERYAEAAQAYAHLAERLPDNPQVLVDWADVLGAANGRSLKGEPEALIRKALEIAPEHPKARALAGSVAFENGDYAAAAGHWEAVLAQIPPQETELITNVRGSIDEARKRAGLPPLAAAVPAPVPATSAAGGLSLKGELSLDPALAGKVKADDSIFIFVRGGAGGPPLAAQRHRVADLPLKFDFSNTPLMMAGAPLPPQLNVGARISRSGNAAAGSGDLEGLATGVAPDAAGISLVINHERP